MHYFYLPMSDDKPNKAHSVFKQVAWFTKLVSNFWDHGMLERQNYQQKNICVDIKQSKVLPFSKFHLSRILNNKINQTHKKNFWHINSMQKMKIFLICSFDPAQTIVYREPWGEIFVVEHSSCQPFLTGRVGW